MKARLIRSPDRSRGIDCVSSTDLADPQEPTPDCGRAGDHTQPTLGRQMSRSEPLFGDCAPPTARRTRRSTRSAFPSTHRPKPPTICAVGSSDSSAARYTVVDHGAGYGRTRSAPAGELTAIGCRNHRRIAGHNRGQFLARGRRRSQNLRFCIDEGAQIEQSRSPASATSSRILQV